MSVKPTETEPELLKIPAIAERLNVSRTKAYELATAQKIPAWKLGAEWVASSNDLILFINTGGMMMKDWLAARAE